MTVLYVRNELLIKCVGEIGILADWFQITTNKMQRFLIYLFLQTLYMFLAVPPPNIRSTQLQYSMYSYLLLLLGWGTARNMYSVCKINKSRNVASCWL